MSILFDSLVASDDTRGTAYVAAEEAKYRIYLSRMPALTVLQLHLCAAVCNFRLCDTFLLFQISYQYFLFIGHESVLLICTPTNSEQISIHSTNSHSYSAAFRFNIQTFSILFMYWLYCIVSSGLPGGNHCGRGEQAAVAPAGRAPS